MRLFRVAIGSTTALWVLLAVIQCADKPAANEQPGISAAAVEIDGWHQEAEAEIFVGDSLFELINGGAEVYHRFGFVQALAAQYADAAGRSIALEVFEMKDVAGAQSIYADKTGESGEPLAIGDEAAGEDYYLNFRSGRFLVTITGFDGDPETREGILLLARAVAARLGGLT